jgi:hypothetical protein
MLSNIELMFGKHHVLIIFLSNIMACGKKDYDMPRVKYSGISNTIFRRSV